MTHREARSHYAIWGNISDEFLWNSKDRLPTTTHFWCTVTHADFPTFSKTFYVRKTMHTLADLEQPDEAAFWLAHSNAGTQVVQQLLQQTHAEDTPFSVLARASTITKGKAPTEMPKLVRNLAGLACAGSHILAYHDTPLLQDPFILLVMQQDLRTNVLTFIQGSSHAELAFNPISNWPDYEGKINSFSLNPAQPDVVEHKTLFPGYWMNRADFPALLMSAIDQKYLELTHQPVVEIANRYGIPTRTQTDFANSFLHPKKARALVDLFVTFPTLANFITQHAADGPNLIKVSPTEWVQSCQDMLTIATESNQ